MCKAVRWGEVLENNILEKNIFAKNIFAQIFLSKIFPNKYIFIINIIVKNMQEQIFF